MYNIMSPKAEEFISHEEILSSLAYAEANKSNRPLIDEILAKARKRQGLSHREAAVLLDCDLEDKNQEIYALAEQIKKISMETASLCLLPYIYRITASMAANIAPTMPKTNTLPARS